MTFEDAKTLATIAGPCIAILALVVSGMAFWQARRSMRAQTFLAALKLAEDIKLSKWMDFIRRLRVTSYSAFLATATADEQLGVRSIIDYFNQIGHLVRHGYLTKNHVVHIYWASLRDIEARLLPWWLAGFRTANGQPWYYITFEWLVKEAI